MDSKKLKNTVRIGIITKIEMKREDIYQKFILIIYIPPYKYGKYLCPHFKKSVDTQKKIKNQILLGYAEPP